MRLRSDFGIDFDVLVGGGLGEGCDEGLEDAEFHASDAADVDEGSLAVEDGGELLGVGSEAFVDVHGAADAALERGVERGVGLTA